MDKQPDWARFLVGFLIYYIAGDYRLFWLEKTGIDPALPSAAAPPTGA
jgi:hypothetical protein